MPSSRSSRRLANVAMQSLLGAIFLGLWGVLAIMVFNDDVGHVIATSIPYFIFFELGVLSRYVPGLKDYAKRIE
jgi:hypothetical protein